MLGASREAMSTLTDLLADRGASGVEADLADQLYSVADLLGRDRPLRTALADAGTPAQARSALAGSLLADRISASALELVNAAVMLRWSAEDDLVMAIESLAAQAAFEVADQQGSLDATEEEIFRFGRAVDASSALQMALTNPSLTSAVKASIVDSLLADRTTATTRQVVGYAVGHLHGRRLDSAIDALISLAASQRERVVAEIRVAAPLEPQQHQRLAAVLGQISGRQVRLNVSVGPALLGGVHVILGDEIIDGTVLSRLDQARRSVLGSS